MRAKGESGQKLLILGMDLGGMLRCICLILGRSFSSLLQTCLGLPLGFHGGSKSSQNPLIAKFEKKLPTWKRQYLSSGGQPTCDRFIVVFIQRCHLRFVRV